MYNKNQNMNNNSYKKGTYPSAGYIGGLQKQFVKHSGAKLTRYTPESGDNKGFEMHLVTAWKLNRSKELISIKATTTSKSKLSDKGWFGSVAVTLTNTTTGETNFHWGTMEKKSGKTVIQSCSMVLNPKAKNGGFAGSYINSDK